MSGFKRAIIGGIAGIVLSAAPISAQSEHSRNAYEQNTQSHYTSGEIESIATRLREHGHLTRIGYSKELYDYSLHTNPPLDELLGSSSALSQPEERRIIMLRYAYSIMANLEINEELQCTVLMPTGEYVGYAFKEFDNPESMSVEIGMQNPLSALEPLYYATIPDAKGHASDARICFDTAIKGLNDYVDRKH
jgi:hypothetical protein